MTPNELIGQVGRHLIAGHLADARSRALTDVHETVRLVLDLLEPEHVGAIVGAVSAEPALANETFIRIKPRIAQAAGLPHAFHSAETEVWLRHHEPPEGKTAVLIASDGDDQRESLEELTRIAVEDFRSAAEVWVGLVTRDQIIAREDQVTWSRALLGLAESRVSLQQFAGYVAATRARLDVGEPLLAALGEALPQLQLPRDVNAFIAIPEKQRGQKAAWRRRFDAMFSDRRPLLTKHLKSGQVIEAGELQRQLDQLVQDGLLVDHIEVFQDFIDAPTYWCDASQALAELQWDADHVSEFFTGIRQQQDRNLATMTLTQFADEGLALSRDEEDYLKTLAHQKSFKQSHEPADREFYEQRIAGLGANPRMKKLKSKWDSFVFGSAVTCTDLFDGLIEALQRLCARIDFAIPRELEIKVHGKGDRYFRELNADVAELFSLRYRSLGRLLGARAKVDLGPLQDYPAFLAAQRQVRGFKRSVSTARTATQIRLDLKLISQTGNDQVVQLHWIGSPNAVAVNLPEDLRRLREDPLLTLAVERNRVSRKGEAQRLSLADQGSFEPVYGQESGTLVPREDRRKSWRGTWLEELERAVQRSALSRAQGQEIRVRFEAFDAAYRAALQAFADGTVDDSLLTQAEAYGGLLATLAPVMYAEMDLPRRQLVQPLLSLGVVHVNDPTPHAVVAPWHPLRLAAIAVKTQRVATFTRHVLESDSVDFGDSGLFFRDFREQLRHPHYPEVVLGYRGESPVLLTITDTLDEYSLAEEPHPLEADWRSDSDPSDAAARIKDIVTRYLELQPHEQANLSVALYNCESAGLPIAAIDALSDLQESDVHCHVVLRHERTAMLRRVYTELLEHADADPDALVASETSRNFMANLRVGIQLETPAMMRASDARAVDIAFLDDVVSRRAGVKMLPAPNDQAPPPLSVHVPGHWSYRLPIGTEQTRASRYLVCPEQPRCVLEQIRATVAVVDPVGGSAPYRLPVRELAFNDDATRNLLRDVHNLAEWVVNHDDLLEPEQLRNLGVQVIRYRRDATRGRNLIVSSTAQSGLLLALVQRRLNVLALGLPDAELKVLAERLVADATAISGEIALRATKRGEFAGELIGVVLSHALVREELGAASPQAWYFLDDYASWLGQREGGIADLIVLSPERIDGQMGLRIRVTEAKYVSDAIVGDMRKRSRGQLENTVNRIREALFGNPGRLDRDLWLSRLSELLVQASHATSVMQTFTGLQRAIREGAAPIDLRGYSHLFVSGPADARSASVREELPAQCGAHALQEVFCLEATRELLIRYARHEPLSTLRPRAGEDRPWEQPAFELPAARPSWTRGRAPGGEDGGSGSARLPQDAPVPVLGRGTPRVVEAPRAQVVVDEGHVPILAPPASTGLDGLIDARARSAPAADDSAWLDKTVLALRQALTSYGLQAQVIDRRLTPNAALVRLRGSDRLGVRDIETRRSQLLTSHGLSIINVAARPLEIIVSVARPERETVSLWDVWRQAALTRVGDGVDLCLLIGVREIDGEPFYLNLGEPRATIPAHAPHTLVAGTTGSGKSVLIQNLLLELAARNAPEQVRIHVIDPKQGVDYYAFEGLPHLEGGIITEQEPALALLERMVAEMDRRYAQFREAQVNKLSAYNAKVGPTRALPVVLIVHDEFAEWMLTETYRDAVTNIVSRLSVKARAAGIHLLFAAQRPDNLVMPMQLRDNLGNRLVLRVEGEGTSEIALGQRGAERLLGRGHVAARLTGEPEVIFGQVPYLSGDDAMLVVAQLRSLGAAATTPA